VQRGNAMPTQRVPGRGRPREPERRAASSRCRTRASSRS